MDTVLNQPINYEQISESINVFGLLVESKDTSKFTKDILKDKLLNIKGIRPVEKYSDGLNILYLPIDTTKLEAENLAKELNLKVIEKTIKDNIINHGYFEILKKLLPQEITVPTSFETLGHLAFLNLKEPQLPYRFLIGRVILDTTNRLKTVVTKVENLKNEFRNPTLELIAGEPLYEVEFIEEKLNMVFDVRNVYFCSRLHYERTRILSLIKGFEFIADVFCGIGPFALRAAKERTCKVWANDLNPECFKSLT